MKPVPLRITFGLLLLFAPDVTRADTIKLQSKPAFRDVRITNLRDGRLVFQGVSRQQLRKPLAQIEWIELDRVPALGQAEHARAAERWTEAIAAYRQVLRQGPEPWLADLARLRLLDACDRGGLFDQAVSFYAELLPQNAALVADAAPRRPGPPGSAVNRTARRRLVATLMAGCSATTAAKLRNLLLEIALYDDTQKWPALLAEATEPGDDPKRTPPRLPASSFVLSAAGKNLAAGKHRRAVRLLERSLPYVQAGEDGPWRLLLGRCRLARGEYAEAAAELVRVAETDPDPATAGEALYYLGLAHERLDRPELAADLYRELLERENVPAEVRTQARAGLSRVGD